MGRNLRLAVGYVLVYSCKSSLAIADKQGFQHEILHVIFQVKQSMLQLVNQKDRKAEIARVVPDHIVRFLCSARFRPPSGPPSLLAR